MPETTAYGYNSATTGYMPYSAGMTGYGGYSGYGGNYPLYGSTPYNMTGYGPTMGAGYMSGNASPYTMPLQNYAIPSSYVMPAYTGSGSATPYVLPAGSGSAAPYTAGYSAKPFAAGSMPYVPAAYGSAMPYQSMSYAMPTSSYAMPASYTPHTLNPIPKKNCPALPGWEDLGAPTPNPQPPIPGLRAVPIGTGLNLRTTTSQKCEVVLRRGSYLRLIDLCITQR